MSDKGAIIKIITNKTREHTDLLNQHNALMVVHTKTVNDLADKCLTLDEMKKSVRDLTKIIIQWERENEILQESLDGCQLDNDRLHGEIDHLISKYGVDLG